MAKKKKTKKKKTKKKTKALPEPIGRPSKYDPDFHPQSYVLLSEEGKAKAQIAAEWGISRETLREWGKDKKRPEFSCAVRHGDALREAWWIEEGKRIITSGKGNGHLFAFFMKNINNWTDKRETEVNFTAKPSIINKRDGSKEELGYREVDEIGEGENEDNS